MVNNVKMGEKKKNKKGIGSKSRAQNSPSLLKMFSMYQANFISKYYRRVG